MSEEKKSKLRASETFAYLGRRGTHIQKETRRHLRYTNIMRKIKYVMPVLAVLLLLLVFLWPNLQEKALTTIVDDLASKLEMQNLRFEGIDEKGQPYVIKAEKAIQSAKNIRNVQLMSPEGSLKLDTGDWIYAKAKVGTYNQDEKYVTLQGNVLIYQNEGYEFSTEEINANLAKGLIYGDKKLSAHGPMGWITGTGFRVYDHGAVVEILGPVHLEYLGQADEGVE